VAFQGECRCLPLRLVRHCSVPPRRLTPAETDPARGVKAGKGELAKSLSWRTFDRGVIP
jgi:hypothetical protein